MKSKFINKFVLGCFLAILVRILTFSFNNEYSIDFQDELSKINYKNTNISIPDVNIKDYTFSISDDDMITYEDYSNIFLPKEVKSISTVIKNDAIEDINLYFKILKSTYAPYKYYGGDEAFLQAKEKILDYIYKYEGDTVNVNSLEDFMKESLNFIKDRHFYVGDNLNSDSILGTSTYYYNDNFPILKNTLGYYVYYGGVNYYIKSINSEDNIEKYLKTSINNNGELVQNIGMLEVYNGEDHLNINVVFYRGESEYPKEIELRLASNFNETTSSNFDYTEVDNIPVTSIRRMPYHISVDGIDLTETSLKTKNEKISILDLRSNSGGDILVALDWINTHFGVVPEGNSLYLLLYGRVNDYLTYANDIYFNDDINLLNLEKLDDYYYANTPKTNTELHENENIIFALTDKNTSAAAEFFIENLKDFNNVVVVGTNTNGTLQSSNIELGYLPNSQIEFSYGNWLKIFDDEFFKEGEGIKPDLWVDGDDALDLVLKLISNYELIDDYNIK
ncbi:S41 family peptidase [Clostridium sp.]|uniref:S41 family peptidase n=1 Tax=Clostridium sp. TaxID=1506 RepID=UPI0032165CF4